MKLIEKNEFKPKIKNTFQQLIKFDSKWRLNSKEMKHYELMKLVLDESRLLINAKNKKDLENENRLENIKELLERCKIMKIYKIF